MRKGIALFLAVAMILTIFMPFNSYAQTDYDKQLKDAIIKCKKLFEITDEYDKFSSDVSSYDGKTYFDFNWLDSKGKLGNIKITTLSDGTIVSYEKNKPYYEDKSSGLPKITKKDGLRISKKFINKVNPNFLNNIFYVENDHPLVPNDSEFNYYFIRSEYGVPYYDNNINIFIDNNTGEVLSYYVNWDKDLVFPDTKDIISIDKAKEVYKEKIGLNLFYRIVYENNDPKVYLAYGVLNNNELIDAKTGELMYRNYYEFDKNAQEENTDSQKEELSPDEKDAISSASEIISKEEAEKKGREILEIDDDFKLSSINIYSFLRNKGNYIWMLEFNKAVEDNNYSASVILNANTGGLISYDKCFPMEPDAKVKYKEDEALEIAKDYIKKMNPDELENIEYIPTGISNKNSKEYYFRFVRKEEDAYLMDNGINVVVNGVDGTIDGYEINWMDYELPSKDNIISTNEAYKILFDDIEMELKYITTIDNEDENNLKKKVKLCYGIKEDKPLNIDANTGKILNYTGKPYKEAKIIKYKDIDESYAKEKIDILNQYGIAFPQDEFKPKENMTQKDFLYLLAKANFPYDFDLEEKYLDGEFYKDLINSGIITEEELAPDSIITKEEGVKYIIRALGLQEVAEIGGIYKDLFKDTNDIDPELKGYVSIAYGLNIVQGNDGYIRPKAALKREDGANMIYNFLFNN